MADTRADAARDAAIAHLPSDGSPMDFGAWIDGCVADGLERAQLRAWPKWRDAGLIVTQVAMVDGMAVHTVNRGDG